MNFLITSQEFFALSSFLNYQLSGSPVNWGAVLSLISDKLIPTSDREHLIDTLQYLGKAYGQQKRKLGPFAVLHPFRSAALLARSQSQPNTLDMLTALLHDKDEEITEGKYSTEDWEKINTSFQRLISRIDSDEKWYLNERVHFLAKEDDEKYHEYLGRMIHQSRFTPELIRVKLADRMDNTLDLRMDLYEDSEGTDSYQVIFEALFANSYRGPTISHPYHIDRKINGAMRLYQLFKTAVFLSMLRSEKVLLDESSQLLFDSLAKASVNEALNIMLHIFAYHMRETGKHKALLLDAMDYCGGRHISTVNKGNRHCLDGLFKNYFDWEQKEELKQLLSKLYSDKELMIEASVAFAAIFTNFLNDSEFMIKGITANGLHTL